MAPVDEEIIAAGASEAEAGYYVEALKLSQRLIARLSEKVHNSARKREIHTKISVRATACAP